MAVLKSSLGMLSATRASACNIDDPVEHKDASVQEIHKLIIIHS